MASVETAPNDLSDDRSATEKEDTEDENKEDELVGDSESEVSLNDDLTKCLLKIEELQKQKKKNGYQYSRVLKQKDDNVRGPCNS